MLGVCFRCDRVLWMNSYLRLSRKRWFLHLRTFTSQGVCHANVHLDVFDVLVLCVVSERLPGQVPPFRPSPTCFGDFVARLCCRRVHDKANRWVVRRAAPSAQPARRSCACVIQPRGSSSRGLHCHPRFRLRVFDGSSAAACSGFRFRLKRRSTGGRSTACSYALSFCPCARSGFSERSAALGSNLIVLCHVSRGFLGTLCFAVAAGH